MSYPVVKVLHIFGKMNRGGAEMRTLEVMPLLREKGIHFDFCTLGGKGPGQLDERIHQMGSSIFECPLDAGLRRFSRKFLELLMSHRYDVVHSHVYYYSGKILQLAHKAKVSKRIAHFRTEHDGKPVTLFRRLYHLYMRHLINRHATDILAVCKGVMDSSWKNWTADHRCRVIYNGIDVTRFNELADARGDVCREFGIPDSHKILINVGSFQIAKAHDVLLTAMADIVNVLPDTELLLVGQGSLKEEMIQKAASLRISRCVHFTGLRDDVPRLLKAADCFVLSSRREGLPGVVLEALAAGLPVVATDLPGVREIGSFSRNITIVPAEDPAALSDATLRILKGLEKMPFKSDAFPVPFDLLACVNAFYDMYTLQGSKFPRGGRRPLLCRERARGYRRTT